ncbi:MAG: hypothetical protein P0S94_03565 [Simkaniaceae bacterium]|nr:hypothetical protein [Simkaniaceae bacterium]
MFILKLLILVSSFLIYKPQLDAKRPPLSHLLNLDTGKKQWMTLPLAESYEYKIINGKGALYLHEYRKLFSDLGLKIHHLEIKEKLVVFEDQEALRSWVNLEIAPTCGTDRYIMIMEEKGWLKFKDGKIRFPRQQLRVLLSHPKDSL